LASTTGYWQQDSSLGLGNTLFAIYRQKASYGFALGKVTGHPLLQRQRAWSTYWYGQGASGQRKGWGREDAGQCPGGPRGRCPGAVQLDTQLYGYSLMKSGNLCMEWLRTVPSCGAACSYAGPV